MLQCNICSSLERIAILSWTRPYSAFKLSLIDSAVCIGYCCPSVLWAWVKTAAGNGPSLSASIHLVRVDIRRRRKKVFGLFACV